MKPSQTVSVFGMDLPVIAELSGGYYLVAHPNGPGIATATSLSTLCVLVRDRELLDSFGHVAIEAVEAYEKATWPTLRSQFYEDGVEYTFVDGQPTAKES